MLAGRRLEGSGPGGCAFRLPRTAKGERLSVAVTGRYGTTKVARRYAFTVR